MYRLLTRIGVGALLVIVAIAGTIWAMKWFAPGMVDRRPRLADTPPLPPVSRNSMIVLPAIITLPAIRNALEAAAPPEHTGKLGMPQIPNMPNIPNLPNMANAEIGWSVTRSPLEIAGRPEGLQLWSSLRGSVRATGLPLGQGDLPKPPAGFGGPPGFGLPGGFRVPPGFGPPGGFFGPPGGTPSSRDQGSAATTPAKPGTTQDQRAEFAGNVMLAARPEILPNWRLAPNLAVQVSIGDASLSILGMQLNLSNEMKPKLEQLVSDQAAALQSRMSNDPTVERAAREGWARMCRSIPLATGVPGAPKLWLELRPTRAMAAQPRIDNNAVTLTLGAQADTRIVAQETRPDCPFPAQLDIVQQLDRGSVKIEMPVDMPLTEVNRLIETQLKGKVFPEDGRGAVTATIRSVNVSASGDRLLLSIGITANETKSWFGFSADGTVHVWGRPSLDRGRQTLRFDDITVDIESESAFGALALAARAAVPALERTVAENAVIDLLPIAADIRRNIESAISDSRNAMPGVQVDASVVDVRLADVAFDAKTLRVIVEAGGTVRIVVTQLPNR